MDLFSHIPLILNNRKYRENGRCGGKGVEQLYENFFCAVLIEFVRMI